MNKDFITIQLDGNLSLTTIEKIDDNRIQVTTDYKTPNTKPYIQTVSIDSVVFEEWYAINESKLVITY